MAKQTSNVLTEEFLMDLFYTCMENDYILAVVMEHVRKEYLPDRDFITLHSCLRSYYKDYKKAPTFSILKQMIANNKSAVSLLDDIYDSASVIETEQMNGWMDIAKWQREKSF